MRLIILLFSCFLIKYCFHDAKVTTYQQIIFAERFILFFSEAQIVYLSHGWGMAIDIFVYSGEIGEVCETYIHHHVLHLSIAFGQ